MNLVNPDNDKDLENFYREWKSHYPDSKPKKNGEGVKTGLKPPSVITLRILWQYGTQGSIPGENVVAMLQNDLYGTFNTSPAEELELIPSSIQYITTYLPAEAWGSEEKFGKWINKMRKSKSFRPTDFY